MKWFIASDIHGSALYCKKMLEAFESERADRILLLGDILYHGPRNALPAEYEPKRVAQLLNSVKDKLVCVQGNCDSQVDQMLLEFPIFAPYALLDLGEHLVFATHGHEFGFDSPPPLSAGDILLCGHTHVPACEKKNGFVYLNPGSVSIPKENSSHGYMLLEGGEFIRKDFDGRVSLKYVAE